MCARRAGGAARPLSARRRHSGVRTDLSAGESIGWSPNGEPSWRRAASQLPARRLRRQGRAPSGVARPGPARHGLDCRAVEGEGMAGGVGRGGNAVPEAARGGRPAGVCPSGEGDRRDRLRGPFRGGALAPGLSPSWLCYSHCLPASLLEDVRCSSWGEGQRNKNCTSFTQYQLRLNLSVVS